MAFEHNVEAENLEDVRVTSKDLARALAAIEARRHAQQERDFDTITLGDAIRQLNLDLTAEDLLAEIRTLHAAEAEAVAATSRRLAKRSRLRSRASAIAATLGLVLVAYVGFAMAAYFSAPRAGARTIPAAAAIGDGLDQSMMSRSMEYRLTHDRSDYVTLDVIHLLNKGIPASRISRRVSGNSGPWEIVMVNGKILVRGYRDRIQNGYMHVYSNPPPGTNADKYRECLMEPSQFSNVRDPIRKIGVDCEEVYIPAD